MAQKKNPYIGKWLITEMELWDQEYVNEMTEGHFTFKKDDMGHFQFCCVEGDIDYRIEKCGEIERLEFSWEGQDDSDYAFGRGYVTLKGDMIEGKIYFHMGDVSWFKAERKITGN